jgi:DNA-binding transcriptional LysR family regulator
MEFDQLRTFLAVLEHGSFVRAGQALHIGQSTVSFHVKALEESVGSSLVERGRRRVGATAAGRILVPFAERILALREEALGALAGEQNGETGRLSIAASTIPGEYLLPPLLAHLRTRHPRISIEVEVSDSEKAAAALLARGCDLALVGRRPRDRRIAILPCGHDEIVLVGLAPNPFAPEGRLTLRELRGVPLILREKGSGTREAVAKLLPHVTGAIVRVGSTEAAKRCVQHGLGLSFLSRMAVADELAAGLFQVVALPGTPVRREFYALRLRASTPSTVACYFLELLNQQDR